MTWAVPDWWTTALLALAAYRVWRLLAHDTILDPIRHRLVRAESKQEEFLQCPYCSGAHIAALWWLAWIFSAHWTLVVAVPFAISALVALVAVNLDPD